MSTFAPAALALSPQGHVHLHPHPPDDSAVDERVLARIRRAFDRGSAAGLLHLGAAELDATLPPTFSYWRGVGSQFVARTCALIRSGEVVDLGHVTPPAGLLESLAASAPPMTGIEYLSADVLGTIWTDLNQTLLRAAADQGRSVQEYLSALDATWQLVGKVCFHLAELRDSPVTPFAFLATYVGHISAGGRAQHVQLSNAVRASAGARDRTALLALLAPVERAAARSPFLKSLVDSGEIYQTPRWTPREAYQFLQAIPAIEAGGVTVRVPDWWTPGRPRRVRVQVTVGGNPPSRLGEDALLDFSIDVALDGARLTKTEWDALRRNTDGLAFVKGRWVEVDRAKLEEVLAHWRHVQRAASGGLISFSEGMRLLAGAAIDGVHAAAPVPTSEWSSVDAGPWLETTLRKLRSPEAGAAPAEPDGFTASLRPYQHAGLRWLTLLHGLRLGGCLADDMGLGKTIQMLAFWTSVRRQDATARHLLVVPASLLGNWQAEAARFAPALRLYVAHPSVTPRDALAKAPKKADVVVTTYGYLHRLPWLAERQWDTIVLDEAQAIKNPGSRQTRLVKQLASRSRFALTGTPIENRLGDLWSLFDFLCPGLLGSSKAFGAFVDRIQTGGAGYAPLRALVQPYILRRLKSDKRVIADLPDKTEVRAFCPLTKTQAVLYQSSVEALARQLRDREGIERRGVILAFLMRFKQICNHPSQSRGDGGYDPAESGKFARLRELCETIAGRQEKLLVFTQFKEIADPLAEYLGGVFGRPGLVLHGGTPARRRASMVAEFQRENGPPFFVISLKAGGTGLNLTAAAHVVHFDRWWNPAVENQATDRAYRIGQRKNVLVHKFVCRGTVEERIDELIASKLALSRDVLETGGEAMLTELSNEELMSLVRLNLDRAAGESA